MKEFDYVLMGEKIISLMKDVELAKKMGKKGRAIVAKLNDPVARIENIYLLLQKAIANNKLNIS